MARGQDGDDSGNDSGIERRSVLRLAGAAALGGAGAATASRASAQSFENVVDVVEAGADPNGGTPIDSVVSRLAGNDTLLEFPDGTYEIGQLSLSGLRNFGMRAADGANPTFVPAQPRSSQGEVIVLFSGGSGWLLEGIDFDYRQRGYGGRIQIVPSGGFTLRDVEIHGSLPDNTMASRFQVGSANATGVVENFVAKGGAEGDDVDATGIFVGKPHAGELHIRNCQMHGFSNNGIYASAPGLADGGNGPVIVEGGLYKNNNVAGVRIGSEGSRVSGVTVVVDRDAPTIHGALNSRGIRVRDRQDQVIEDCDVILTGGRGEGGVVLHPEAGRVFVRNTRIRVDTNAFRGVLGKSPSRGGNVGPVFENVSITGSASSDAAFLVDRDETTFRNCCIQKGGGDGVVLSRSRNCVIADSNINVPGQAVDLSGSTADTRNLTNGGTCPVPDADPGDGSSGGDSGSGGDDGSGGDSGSGGDGDDGSSLPNVLSISGGGPGSLVTYEFSVSGALERSTDNGATVDPEDAVSGSNGQGAVAGGTDSYRFEGEVTAFRLDGDATVTVNGEAVDPSTLGGDLPRSLSVRGGSPANRVDYSFTASEGLAKSSARNATIDDGDVIDGTSVEGRVAGGTDSYRFAGELTDFAVSDDVTVFLDGEEVDPASLGSGGSGDDSESLPNTIVVDGSGDLGSSTYEFAVSGDVAAAPDLGGVESRDEIGDGVVSGRVTGGKDAFRFSGDVVGFTLMGSAQVSFERNGGA